MWVLNPIRRRRFCYAPALCGVRGSRAPLLHTHFLPVLNPLLQWLDAQIDRRLVRTFVATVAAILTWRMARMAELFQ